MDNEKKECEFEIDGDILKLLKQFTVEDDKRPTLKNAFISKGYVYALDGRRLIKMPIDYIFLEKVTAEMQFPMPNTVTATAKYKYTRVDNDGTWHIMRMTKKGSDLTVVKNDMDKVKFPNCEMFIPKSDTLFKPVPYIGINSSVLPDGIGGRWCFQSQTAPILIDEVDYNGEPMPGTIVVIMPKGVKEPKWHKEPMTKQFSPTNVDHEEMYRLLKLLEEQEERLKRVREALAEHRKQMQMEALS